VSQRQPDYEDLRARQARAQEADRIGSDNRGTWGIDFFYDSHSAEYSARPDPKP
jgi:hypothetical protein